MSAPPFLLGCFTPRPWTAAERPRMGDAQARRDAGVPAQGCALAALQRRRRGPPNGPRRDARGQVCCLFRDVSGGASTAGRAEGRRGAEAAPSARPPGEPQAGPAARSGWRGAPWRARGGKRLGAQPAGPQDGGRPLMVWRKHAEKIVCNRVSVCTRCRADAPGRPAAGRTPRADRRRRGRSCGPGAAKRPPAAKPTGGRPRGRRRTKGNATRWIALVNSSSSITA